MSEYNTPNDPNAVNPTPNEQPAEAPQDQQDSAVSEDAAKEQARRDAEFRAAHLNEPVARDANPEVGGESNDYLKNVRG